MYGSTTSKTRLEDSRKLLSWIYKKIPDTKGCMEHINKAASEGGCGGWCCKEQNPQVLYVEFLNSFNHVKKNWSKDNFIGLVDSALRAYLYDDQRKTCIFWDKQTHLCRQHETRPYSCRVYGITPDDEFKPRYERLKVLYPDTRYQCDLVSTVSGKPVTKADTDGWWNMLVTAEKSLGIKPEIISDAFGGSYRNYYEHLLLELVGEDGMIMLSEMRLAGSDEQKEAVIKQALDGLRSFADGGESSDNNIGVQPDQRPDILDSQERSG